MEYSGKGTSCEMEIDKLQYPTSSTSRRRRDAPKELHSNFPLQPLYQKTVVDEKKALVHFMWEGRGRGGLAVSSLTLSMGQTSAARCCFQHNEVISFS